MYLFLDLETTGLDPKNDHILEIGWTWVDDDLVALQPVQSFVVTPSPQTWELIEASQFIQEMHGPNGLLEELTKEGTLLRHDIEDMILKEIQNHMETGTIIKLAGFGPHFDHEFIRNWLPRLNNKLSYRHFDVRTLTQFFGPLGIENDVVNFNPHRAKSDVAEALAVAKSYRRTVLDLKGM